MTVLRRKIRRVATLAVFLALCGSLPAGVHPAAAQGFGWFGGFFGGGQPEGPYGDPRDPDNGGGYYAPRHRPQHRKPAAAVQDLPAKPKAPPKNATVFVDVYGDSFGQLLANGLDDALADKPEVGIVHLARGPSGLANATYYDWPKTIEDALARQHRSPKAAGAKGSPGAGPSAKDKTEPGKEAPDQGQQEAQAKRDQDMPNRIDVAVMMIGSNDRQPIVEAGKRIEVGTDEWTALYRKRVMAIAEAFQKKKIPLIWVGVPIVKNDDVADDMAALNDIYRDVAAKTGAAFVDTWDSFSDDNGDFAAYGPDVDGQTVRLRTADGIYFTKAGARKLAHFVESQVRRDLDGRMPVADLPTGDASGGQGKKGAPSQAAPKPEAGPIKKLGEAPLAKDGHLLEVTRKDDLLEDATLANALVKGQPNAAPAGRADDFHWPKSASKPSAQ